MRKTFCDNWDSAKPQVIRCAQSGDIIGTLAPRVTGRVLAASVGIQSHSKPGYPSRVTPYGGAANVLHFARHWHKHTGRTYPFSTR